MTFLNIIPLPYRFPFRRRGMGARIRRRAQRLRSCSWKNCSSWRSGRRRRGRRRARGPQVNISVLLLHSSFWPKSSFQMEDTVLDYFFSLKLRLLYIVRYPFFWWLPVTVLLEKPLSVNTCTLSVLLIIMICACT